MAFAVSNERAKLLETGGGLVRAWPLIDADPFFCLNSDAMWLDGPVDVFHELSGAWDAAKMDALLGPADDGGYWLLALREPCPDLFTDMAWSTPQVFPETMRRLEANGISPHLLPELTDIDTGEDLDAWPDLLA